MDIKKHVLRPPDTTTHVSRQKAYAVLQIFNTIIVIE